MKHIFFWKYIFLKNTFKNQYIVSPDFSKKILLDIFMH